MLHSGNVGLGGHNVTNDIGVGLRTTRAEAEQAKCADAPSETVALIVEARMEEILALARKQVYTALPHAALGAGIVLTGGGARITGAVALAERVFNMPVRLGEPSGFEGAVELASPSYATVLGLLLYGMEQQEGKNQTQAQELVEDPFDSVFRGRVKRWLQPRGLAAVLVPKSRRSNYGN